MSIQSGRHQNNTTFSDLTLKVLRDAKILGVRAGAEHRYTGVWVVVVDDRVFVRSWNNKSTGWFLAFKKEPNGSIRLGKREIPIRTRSPRSGRIRDAVSVAFGDKYHSKASRKWVEGFSEPARLLTTLELMPR